MWQAWSDLRRAIREFNVAVACAAHKDRDRIVRLWKRMWRKDI